MNADAIRCFNGDEQMRQYHDQEWGHPVLDDRGLFERLSLEAFQSGLSWAIVLRKRDGFRCAFQNFDPMAVAAFTPDDIEELVNDPEIIRNRRKIEATISNAQSVLALRDAGTSLSELLWSFRPADGSGPLTHADVPSTTPESVDMARELRRRGFRFVGPTNAYALMQATGMVNPHVQGCVARDATEAARRGVLRGGEGGGGEHKPASAVEEERSCSTRLHPTYSA